MKKAITLIVFFLFSCNSSNLDCNTYYLIRHAEKVRLNPNDKDPELNEAGKERALVWKEYFNELVALLVEKEIGNGNSILPWYFRPNITYLKGLKKPATNSNLFYI